MKPFLLTIVLLFSTPAWANNNVCFYMISGETEFENAMELSKLIESRPCDTLLIHVIGGNFMSHLARFCRYDREIVINDPKGRVAEFSCVPKK